MARSAALATRTSTAEYSRLNTGLQSPHLHSLQPLRLPALHRRYAPPAGELEIDLEHFQLVHHTTYKVSFVSWCALFKILKILHSFYYTYKLRRVVETKKRIDSKNCYFWGTGMRARLTWWWRCCRSRTGRRRRAGRRGTARGRPSCPAAGTATQPRSQSQTGLPRVLYHSHKVIIYFSRASRKHEHISHCKHVETKAQFAQPWNIPQMHNLCNDGIFQGRIFQGWILSIIRKYSTIEYSMVAQIVYL